MNETEQWVAFMDRISDGASGREIATRTGVAASTISRWRTGATFPSPRQVVAVARAYGVHPVAALHAADYISYDEVDVLADRIEMPRALVLEDFTLSELVGEVARRVAVLEAEDARNGLG